MRHVQTAPSRVAAFLFALIAACLPAVAADTRPAPARIVCEAYQPHLGDNAGNRICRQLMREDPDLIVEPYYGLKVEGGRVNSRLLGVAGGTGPDVLFNYWHSIRTEMEQGFLCPLNEFIGYDGFNGLNPATDQPDERTGQPKLRRDPVTGQMVPDRNGNIDDDEALWPYWRNYQKIHRLVATRPGRLERGPDGHPYEGALVYGVPEGPWPRHWGIVYRRDLFRAAGLKEDDIPLTWDEFWRFCQRLTDPGKQIPGARFQRGQRAFVVPGDAWRWLQWVWSNGGDCIRQGRANPRTGRTHWFAQEETEFLDPETGESLALQPSTWRAAFGSPEAVEAMEFYRKLCWQPWLRHPRTGEPLDLAPQDLARGWIADPRTGERIEIVPEHVIRGVVRKGLRGEDVDLEMFRRGEVAMIMFGTELMEDCHLPPNNLGFFAVPAGRGKPTVGSFSHYWTLSHKLAGPARGRERAKAWQVLSALVGPRGQQEFVEAAVREGFARFLAPRTLRAAGLDEFIEQIPRHWRDRHEEVIRNARAEPFMGNWEPAQRELMSNVIEPAMTRETFDVRSALLEAESQANGRLMFGLSEEIKARYRPWALLGVLAGAALLAVAAVQVVRSYRETSAAPSGAAARAAGSTRGVAARGAPWMLLAPALLSIVVWSYYPLGRGSVMAFQDYRIIGESRWVGVDNFITVFTDAKFYLSIVKTLKFGALSLGIGFLVPIVLAVMLTEIPRGRVFLRTVYFLPQISSGLVVLFIWKLMYNETEYGLLNQLLLASNTLPLPVVALVRAAVVAVAALVLWVLYRLAFTLEHSSRAGRVGFRLLFFAVAAVFAAGPAATVLRFGPLAAARDVAAWFLRSPGFTAQNWLGDPRWTMAAVIVPGVWAGAGMSSLLYLAALKCVDEESYEAADLDGAGSLAKAWYITIPYLKPLILINFIGAFIGVFRSMGGIFAMTGGGPGDETTVLSLLIWIKAFANLRFGEATALAWVLGVALIAFAVFQLRILKRVEFRRADQN